MKYKFIEYQNMRVVDVESEMIKEGLDGWSVVSFQIRFFSYYVLYFKNYEK